METPEDAMKPTVCSLSETVTGQSGTVTFLYGGHHCRERLASMGLSVGSKVRVLRGANGSAGPVLVAAGDSRLAVGRGMCEHVMLQLDP